MNKDKLKQNPFYLKDEDIAWIEQTMSGMSEDEKIGQLFFMAGRKYDKEYINYLTKNLHVGGVMSRPLPKKDLVAMIGDLQKNSKIPMLIAANLENGGNGIVQEGTKIGSNMAVAATGDPEYAYKLGKVCARESKSVGANYAFAPVTDIDYNYRNPIMNTRTFGSDKDVVRKMAYEYMKAVQEEGMCVSIKHFPGDGMDDRDQHLVTSINSMSCDEWDETYGKNYRFLIENGAKTVMVGHIMQPAYSKKLNPGIKSEDILPATLSKELLNGLLRKKLGFNGLIITDATTMSGFCIPMPRDKAVPLAIENGCDMFLFTKNLDEDVNFMKQGLKNGILSKKRLDESIVRILALKASLGLHKKNNIPSIEQADKVIKCDEHKKIAYDAADKSITLVKEEKGVLPITPEKYKNILLYDIESGANALGYATTSGVADSFIPLLKNEGFNVTLFKASGLYEGLQVSFEEIKSKYDLIIYVCNLATKSNQTTVRIEWTNPMGVNVPIYIKSIPTIFISTENPYHLQDVPRVRTYINTYGINEYTLQLIIDKLSGRSPFKGKNPIDPFCGRWDTHLN